jgi:hypothetical protein
VKASTNSDEATFRRTTPQPLDRKSRKKKNKKREAMKNSKK